MGVLDLDVEPDEVPAAVAPHDAPRLHDPRAGPFISSALVIEANPSMLSNGLPNAGKRFAAGSGSLLPGDHSGDVGCVIRRTRQHRLELANGRLGGRRKIGLRPSASRDTEQGPLLGSHTDLRQSIVLFGDAIPEDFPVRRRHGHDRDAEIAQIILVALEHPLEGSIGGSRVIAGDDLADGLTRDRLMRREQAQDEVE